KGSGAAGVSASIRCCCQARLPATAASTAARNATPSTAECSCAPRHHSHAPAAARPKANGHSQSRAVFHLNRLWVIARSFGGSRGPPQRGAASPYPKFKIGLCGGTASLGKGRSRIVPCCEFSRVVIGKAGFLDRQGDSGRRMAAWPLARNGRSAKRKPEKRDRVETEWPTRKR